MGKILAKKTLIKTGRKEVLTAADIAAPDLKGGVKVREVIAAVRLLKSGSPAVVRPLKKK